MRTVDNFCTPAIRSLFAILLLASVSPFGYTQERDQGILGRVLTIATNDPFPPSSYLTTERSRGAFPLVEDGNPARILVSTSDYPGVLRVAELFRKDLVYVSGSEVKLTNADNVQGGGSVIIVGSIGKSNLIDQLVREKKIDVSVLEGKWEQYLILNVKQPIKGVDHALVIAGSDKRATIFGMFDLSEKMGVSPWYWWADVPIKTRKNVFVKPGTAYTAGEPKVKYRGIFINDEAPALTGWVGEKFGSFNHTFYEKVFELILRNKANYLWPAMWRPRVFATDDPENPRIADEYGIVISTTHHEPMMRYHEEWRRYNGGPWNYETNAEKIREFWRGGIERMGDYESVVTVGMRGDGDEAMSDETAVDLLKRIIADQRKILTEVTGKPAHETPQVWAIYKEVQDYYDKGLRVDDDILVLFCDDNWGNIRIVPKKEELNHKGGYGMYYHFDFVGGPVSYRWINVTQVERVWEQMKLAYAWGIRDLWIVNVGDIKPMEIPISFFLDFAWNTDMQAADLPLWYEKWSAQQFGNAYSTEIANIIALYTKYGARRTPEMLKPDTYSLENYREAERILDEYRQLHRSARTLYDKLPENSKPSFYQLVLFPIEIGLNLNEMYIAAGKNRWYASQSRASTNAYADTVREKFFRDAELTRQYHEVLLDGKWNHMMSQTHIGYTNWNHPPVNRMPEVSYIQIPFSAGLGYVVEHGVSNVPWSRGGLFARTFPEFDPVNDQHYFVEIFNRGSERLNFEVSAKQKWISLSSKRGVVQFEEKVSVSIDWMKAPKGRSTGEIVISGAGQTFTIQVPIRNDLPAVRGFVEDNGVVSIEASAFTRKFDSRDVRWIVVPNLGRTGSSVTVDPPNADRQSPGKATPRLEFEFSVFDESEIKVEVYLSPTLNFKKNEGLKYAISIDDEPMQIVNMHEGDSLPDWEYPDWWNNSVTDHIRKVVSVHKSIKPGVHTLKVWMIDPGVVFQKFVIDAGGTRSSYLGPPPSKIR